MDPIRMVVIGAGGTGGWLIEGLARMLEYRAPGSGLVIVDGDNFEPKNIERQNFEDFGNKAVVRVNALQQYVPNTFLVPQPCWVVEEAPKDAEDKIAASDLLEEGDVVYLVVDNFAARKLVFEAAKQLDNVDVFTGGNDDQLFGSVYHYQRRDGEDVIDNPVDTKPELSDPPDRNPGELSCQERAELEGGTQLLATNMAVAALLLARTQKTILEGEEDKEGEIMFDLGLGLSQVYDRAADAVLVPVG